ncbi:hypothetical protein BDV06DRAFT_226359 [Aspergillus oleicola]
MGNIAVKHDDKNELILQVKWTARFDIKQLELALHVPMVPRAGIPGHREVEMGDKTYIKLADAISKHEGIRMKEDDTEADKDWFKGTITTAIPSHGVRYGVKNLDDPDGWSKSEGFKLNLKVSSSSEMIKSAGEILKYYKKGKVPHIRFKARLEEGDDRKPIYVGKDGKEAPKSQGPAVPKKQKPKGEEPETVKVGLDDSEASYWGDKVTFGEEVIH